MSTVALAAPSSPYKGLASYGDSDLDAILFFGRERDREVILANLVASRLTVLYGPTGVGKSSVLRAGVVHRLRELARADIVRAEGPGHAVALVDSWTGDPVEALREVLAANSESEVSGDLVDAVDEWTRNRDSSLYLILDQFEEYFLYHGDADGGPLAVELGRLLSRRDLRVNVLISLREDALAQLDAFKGHIRNLFANPLRLDRLDRRSARSAILGPLARYNELVGPDESVTIEPRLADAVLDEVAAGQVDVGWAGVGEVPDRQATSRIEAPYLQLVLERLWEAERERGSHVLRLSTLEELGGAASIVHAHLEHALDSLSPEQRDAAASIFNHLVTPSGTKIAHRPSDLAEYASLREDELLPVLGALGRERIVRAVNGGGASSERYEIFHDVLADAVLAWRSRLQLDRERRAAERRHRRLLIVALASLGALAVMTAITVYAFSQRTRARDEARTAHARELAASAVSQLDVDPQSSLATAVRAARLERSPLTEDVLRRALLAARLRHVLHVGSNPRFVAFSPGGVRVLTQDSKRVIRVWNAHDGRSLLRLRQSRPAAAPSFDPSGTRLLTAAGDAARLLSAATGRLLATMPQRRVTSAAFSVDGSLIVTAGGDGQVQVWKTGDANPARMLRGEGYVRTALLSHDNSRLLIVTVLHGKNRARLFDARSGRILGTTPAGVTTAAFSHDGRSFATGGADGVTRLWRSADGRALGVFDDGGDHINDISFSRDDSLLATASTDGGVRVWSTAGGGRLYFLVDHTAAITRVEFDPSGSFLVSASLDHTARVWKIIGSDAGHDVALLAGHTDAVRDVEFSSDGRTIATAGDDGTARLWDAPTENELRVVARSAHSIDRAVYSARGVVYVAGARVEIRATGRPRLSSPLPGPLVAVTDDGRLVASVGKGRIEVREATGRRVTLLPTTGPVVALAFRADGQQLATATADGAVVVWDIEHKSARHRLQLRTHALTRIALSPDGDVVLTGAEDGIARLWSAEGKLLHTLRGHPAAITDARFDPSGDRVVTASRNANRNVIIWDVHTGRLLHVLIGHGGTVTAASFSADGRWVLTAGPLSAAVWPAATGQSPIFLRGPTDLLTDAEWSTSGYRVVTSARDGAIRTYRCGTCQPVDGLIALAQARLAAAR
jgi:WD40 repeat protein